MESPTSPSTPPPVEAASVLETVNTALERARAIAQEHTLTLHKHAVAIRDEPVSTPNPKQKASSRSRQSNASTTYTPGSVTADLSYYKELFSKLRFSYLETITKDKYLISILADPPMVYDSQDAENEALELELRENKQILGKMKSDMVFLVSQIELISAKLGQVSTDAASKLAELEALPDELAELDRAIQEELSSLGKSPSQQPHDETLHLPLNETMALVHRLESELSGIDRELTSLTNNEIPRKKRLTEQLEKDLKPLEMDKAGLVGLATQAKYMREREREMGRADRENMGRWYKAANEAMSQLVGPEPL